MTYIPMPENCFLLLGENYDFFRVISKKKTWTNKKRSRYYQWDELHGEVEVYNKRGKHLGAMEDPSVNVITKPRDKSRTIDVS